MRFTTKLSAFITLLVIVTMLLILFSGALSIYYSSNAIPVQDWHILSVTFDQAIVTDSTDDVSNWLPVVMETNNISHIDIVSSNKDAVEYHFENALNTNFWESFVSTKQIVLPLTQNPDYKMTIIYSDPVFKTIFSVQTMATIGGVIAFIVVILTISLNWMKPKFRGISLLEERARSILTGDRSEFPHDSSDEWPKDASKALDLLLQERQKRNKERTHVDTLIRAFFAQDAQTGVRSRLSFEHQLAIQLEEVNAHGVVMMVRLPDFELQARPFTHQRIDKLQETLINILSTFIMRYPSALLARYFNNDFAILLPHFSLKDADNMASQLIQSVNTLSLEADVDKDSLMYIGISAYGSGQSSEMIMDYATQATRNAELQGSNGWFIYDNNIPKVVLGSVRWRTLLTQILETGNGTRFYEKPAITIEGKLHHREIMTRIYDGRQELLAAEFTPWLYQLRLTDKFDQKIVEQLLPMLERWPNETIAFTLNVESLLQNTFLTWFHGILSEKGKKLCRRILIELPESDVARYTDRLLPIVRTLKDLGCQIGVVQAGLTVVSTAYIQQLPLDVIKLYSGLVRHIKMRPENQLIVESLCGACADTNVLIFAAGVRTHSEWEVLCDKGISGGQGDLFAPLERLPI
jgi:RNase E specificity factor CsrD